MNLFKGRIASAHPPQDARWQPAHNNTQNRRPSRGGSSRWNQCGPNRNTPRLQCAGPVRGLHSAGGMQDTETLSHFGRQRLNIKRW